VITSACQIGAASKQWFVTAWPREVRPCAGGGSGGDDDDDDDERSVHVVYLQEAPDPCVSSSPQRNTNGSKYIYT